MILGFENKVYLTKSIMELGATLGELIDISDIYNQNIKLWQQLITLGTD